MRAMIYEWRRLTGVRSTWLIILTVLLAEAALDTVTVRQLIGADAPLRLLTASLPVLPLPVAALGAAALGALAIGQEIRHPELRPLVATRARRLRVLCAKMAVNAVIGLLLGLATLALGLGLLRFGRPDGAALAGGLAHGSALLALAGYLSLVVAAGGTAVVAAGVCRSAAAGVLVLVTGSVLLQPLVSSAYDRMAAAGRFHGRLAALGELGRLHDTAELSPALLAAAVTVPAAVLFFAYAAMLLRRRGM